MSARVKLTFADDFDPFVVDEGKFHPEDFLPLLVKIGDVAKLVPGLLKVPVFPPVPLAPPLCVTAGAL